MLKTYRIYLNVGAGQFWEYSALSAVLQKAYEGQIEDDAETISPELLPHPFGGLLPSPFGGIPVETHFPGALDQLWEQFNVNHPADYKNRSLSVGDVVQLGDEYFAVSAVGWKRLSEAEVSVALMGERSALGKEPTLGHLIQTLQVWLVKDPPTHLQGKLKHRPTISTRIKVKESVVKDDPALWIVYDDETDTLILNQ